MSGDRMIAEPVAAESSYVRDLARVLHSNTLAMFAAHCDESYSGNLKTTRFYVVAGLCGRVAQWEAFEDFWRDTMRHMGITDIGCHAANCAGGWKAYAQMKPEFRDEIQRRLIVDIAASKPLMGFYAALDMEAFRRYKVVLDAEYPPDDRKFNVAHVHAMDLCVEAISQILEDVVATDRIAFVFDRNKEFGGRAHEWYMRVVKKPLMDHHLKLGPFSEDERMEAVGLQAADLLAYTVFRHLNNPERKRWQWDAIHDALHIVPLVADEDYWRSVSVRDDESAK